MLLKHEPKSVKQNFTFPGVFRCKTGGETYIFYTSEERGYTLSLNLDRIPRIGDAKFYSIKNHPEDWEQLHGTFTLTFDL